MIVETLIAAVAAAGALATGGAVVAGRLRRRVQDRREERRRAAEELAAARTLAEEDAVLLGEELMRLDGRTGDAELDDEARQDYRTALEAYERALRAVDELRSTDDLTGVVDALTTGRYALACVVARVGGEPLPARRTPCFFNPQHGPATTSVLWTGRGRGTREVPACAQDAARHAAGERPEVRTLKIDGRQVPYYEVGALLQPYARGYFPATVTEARIDAKAKAAAWHRPGGGMMSDFDIF